MASKTGGMGSLYATVSLDIKDALSKLNQLDKQLTKTFSSRRANAPFTGMTRGARQAGQAVDTVDKSARRAERSTRNFAKSANAATKEVSGLRSSAKGLSNALSSTFASFGAARSGNYFYGISSGIQAVSRGLSGVAGVSGAVVAGVGAIAAILLTATAAAVGFAVGIRKLIKIANESATTLETLAVSFEALFGDRRRAQQELDFIVEAAEVSPYFTSAIVRLNRFLLAQGVLNDELRRNLVSGLIDFGAAAGLTGDGLEGLAYALGQVKNAGKLTGDEMRQLRNNMLPVLAVLQELPKYAEMSENQIKELIEAGDVSAEDFFTGLLSYTGQFEDAAAKQANTLAGLRDTIKDILFELGLGLASLKLDDAGLVAPMTATKNALRAILEVVKRIDFVPLVAALGQVQQAFLSLFSGFLQSGMHGIVSFFQVTLPNAIIHASMFVQAMMQGIRIIVGGAVRAFASMFVALGRVFIAIFGIFGQGTKQAGNGWRNFARVVVVFSSLIIGALNVVATVVIWIAAKIEALIVLFTGGGFSGAGAALGRGLGRIGDLWAGFARDIDKSWSAIDEMETPKLEDLLPDPTELETVTGGGPAFAPGGSDDGKGGKAAADAAAKAMEQAMDALFKMTQRWFGLRTELEQGFLGEKGFEATVSSIAATGKRLIEILRDITGAGNIVTQVKNVTEQLIALARRREEVAERMKTAEKALEDAIKARDSFADDVRRQALDFANAFRADTETVREFELFSDRGFFFEKEEKRQKSFIESLRERYAAMQKFVANVKKLQAAGLDAGLLQEIVAAGPEQAGEVAAQLAAGGDAMIGEVNSLQNSVRQVADELGQFGADAFFQSGVDIAQAQLLGLQSELSGIEGIASSLVQTITDAVLPLAKEMEDAGKAGGAGLAGGLGSTADGLSETMAGLDGIVQGGVGSMVDGIGGMPGRMERGFRSTAQSLTGAVEETWDNLVAGFEKFKEEFGPAFEEFWSNLFETGWQSILNWVTDQWELFWGDLEGIAVWIGEKILDGIVWLVNGVVAAIEKFVNLAIDGMNLLIRAINGLPFIGRVMDELDHIDVGRVASEGGRLVHTPGETYTRGIASASRNVMSGDERAESTYAPPHVQVFIGDKELTDIVDTRVSTNEDMRSRDLVGSRRS